mmetsp:Transcript_41927/g.113062  ORF Transcript_41927/g.113062 Transcript_41927/m.113062 type:complete len:231 (-) Transcript_41927:1089-1781(-)
MPDKCFGRTLGTQISAASPPESTATRKWAQVVLRTPHGGLCNDRQGEAKLVQVQAPHRQVQTSHPLPPGGGAGNGTGCGNNVGGGGAARRAAARRKASPSSPESCWTSFVRQERSSSTAASNPWSCNCNASPQLLSSSSSRSSWVIKSCKADTSPAFSCKRLSPARPPLGATSEGAFAVPLAACQRAQLRLSNHANITIIVPTLATPVRFSSFRGRPRAASMVCLTDGLA